jgi:ABC-2 type transport system permease protein
MKTLFVLRHELVTSFRRRSFQLAAFGIPLISALIFFGVSLLNRTAPDAVAEIINPGQPEKSVPQGYVDLSGLIHTLPAALPEDALRAYNNEAAAKAALLSGEISAYYLIPDNYLESGQIGFVKDEFNPLNAFSQGSLINRVLQLNLLGGDTRLANLLTNPFALEVMILNPSSGLSQDNPLAFFVPYGVMFLYYMLILMSAGFLVSSLNKERESSVLEIMLVTLTPRQLLAGKFIGLGLLGLLVNVLWVGTGFGLMRLSGSTFQLPAEYQFQSYVLVWGVVYFLLGYAVYASLLGAVGALLPNLRETSQATMVVILPMILPLMFITLMIEQPNGLLAVGLSLFPLTSPVTMMLRLVLIPVPAWQLFLSVVFLLLAAVIILRSVARMFRAQTLLSGQPLSLSYVYRLILGRV